MKKNFWHKENTAPAFFLIVFCIITYFFIFPRYIETTGIGMQEKAALSPSFFPKLSVIVIAILALILMVCSLVWREQKREPEHISVRKDAIRVTLTICMTIVYIYMIDVFGFWITTPVFLGIMMMYLGVRRWRTTIAVSVFMVVGIYLFFQRFLHILLPSGSLFD